MNNIKQQREFAFYNRQKLRSIIKNEGVELAVIAGNSFMQATGDRTYPFEQDSNFYYLTGVNEPGVTLVIDQDDEYLIIPERSRTRITFEGNINFASIAEISGIKTGYQETKGWKVLSERVSGAHKVAIVKPPEPYIPSMEMFTNPARSHLADKLTALNKKLELYDLRPRMAIMRMVKSSYELSMINQAIKETQALFKLIGRFYKKAENEQDLLAEINRIIIKKQLSHAYDPIIASGANALTLHYVKNNSQIDKNGMLLLDIGLKYNGYCADITRTISFKPNKRQQQVYDAVLDVQTQAIKFLKPGITVKDYENEVRRCMGENLQKLGLIKVISKETVSKFYPHSTSHFLGLDVHDAANYERPLTPDMVLTVEPGIYIKDEKIGIRLEDDVVITKTGNKILSGALPKNLSSLTIRA